MIYTPLVKAEMIKGKSAEYKKTFLDCVHSALVEALGTEDWDRFQRINETPAENVELPEGKTEDFVIIELTIFPGRSREMKGKAIRLITEKLGRELGIAPTDIFIVINDPPLENWGMGGKQKG